MTPVVGRCQLGLKSLSYYGVLWVFRPNSVRSLIFSQVHLLTFFNNFPSEPSMDAVGVGHCWSPAGIHKDVLLLCHALVHLFIRLYSIWHWLVAPPSLIPRLRYRFHPSSCIYIHHSLDFICLGKYCIHPQSSFIQSRDFFFFLLNSLISGPHHCVLCVYGSLSDLLKKKKNKR